VKFKVKGKSQKQQGRSQEPEIADFNPSFRMEKRAKYLAKCETGLSQEEIASMARKE